MADVGEAGGPESAPDVSDRLDTGDAFDAFTQVDMRVGVITKAALNPGARVPAMHLHVDFGPLGVRESSAQITDHYDVDSLVGRKVVAAVNLGVRRIAGVKSSVLLLGARDGDGVRLLAVNPAVEPGTRIE